MQNKSRIPQLTEVSFDGALMWFSELHCEKLLFHPEDDPASIINVIDGTRSFTNEEVKELRSTIGKLQARLGHEQMVEAAYPIFMNAYGMSMDA